MVVPRHVFIKVGMKVFNFIEIWEGSIMHDQKKYEFSLVHKDNCLHFH